MCTHVIWLTAHCLCYVYIADCLKSKLWCWPNKGSSSHFLSCYGYWCLSSQSKSPKVHTAYTYVPYLCYIDQRSRSHQEVNTQSCFCSQTLMLKKTETFFYLTSNLLLKSKHSSTLNINTNHTCTFQKWETEWSFSNEMMSNLH